MIHAPNTKVDTNIRLFGGFSSLKQVNMTAV
jgi:hypothetical protein